MEKNPVKPRLFAYIRWSTDKQSEGDSERRQKEMALKYAVQHGLELHPEDILIDEGLSAFSGANITSGKLGEFLERVKNKQIPPGSILAIETFDRLSRQAPLDSIALFSQIIQAGIVLVTLNDGQEYTHENSKKIQKLFMPLLSFGTSNQESEHKKERLRATWAEKREDAKKDKKISRMCPGWLRPSSPTGDFHFELIPDRVDTVRWIFEQSAAGIGNHVICRTLNANKVPSFKFSWGSGHWNTSYLNKLLSNEAVLGRYQPHKRIDGEKVVEGEPIKNYFPQIIDEGLFNRAAQSRRSRSTRKDGKKRPVGGRRGTTFANLFTGIQMICAYCGGPIHRRDKTTNGGVFFVCANAQRGLGCEPKHWNYKHFETSFLAHVEELRDRLEELTQTDQEISQRSERQQEINNDKAKLSGIEAKMDDLLELNAIPKVKEKIKNLEAERAKLVAAIAKDEDELSQQASEAEAFHQSADKINVLVERLQEETTTLSPDALYRQRAEVNAALKSLVSSIYLAVVGTKREPNQNHPTDHYILIPEGGAERFFQVVFRNGTNTVIFPEMNDPYEAEEIWSGESRDASEFE